MFQNTRQAGFSFHLVNWCWHPFRLHMWHLFQLHNASIHLHAANSSLPNWSNVSSWIRSLSRQKKAESGKIGFKLAQYYKSFRCSRSLVAWVLLFIKFKWLKLHSFSIHIILTQLGAFSPFHPKTRLIFWCDFVRLISGNWRNVF